MSARPLRGRIEHFFGFSFGSRTMIVTGNSAIESNLRGGCHQVSPTGTPSSLDKNVKNGRKMRKPHCATLRVVYNKLNLKSITPVQKEQGMHLELKYCSV